MNEFHMDDAIAVEEGDQHCLDLGLLQATFSVVGNTNTIPSIDSWILDRTGSTSLICIFKLPSEPNFCCYHFHVEVSGGQRSDRT
jgi:hypothetical protein